MCSIFSYQYETGYYDYMLLKINKSENKEYLINLRFPSMLSVAIAISLPVCDP